MAGELQGLLLNDAVAGVARVAVLVLAGWWAWRWRADIARDVQNRR